MWRVEGGNRGRKFVVTLSRRGFSECFEARTSLIRYLKIPKDIYFDPFISNIDVREIKENCNFYIYDTTEKEFCLLLVVWSLI